MVKKDFRRSATLVELLVVIALLSVFISSFMVIKSNVERGRDTRRKTDTNMLRNALEQSYDSFSCYPPVLGSCGGGGNLDKYLGGIPCDPKTNAGYEYRTDGSSCSQWYRLYARLEREDDPLIDMSGCRLGCGPGCQFNYGVSSPNIGLERCLPTIPPSPTPVPPTPPPPSPTPIQYVCGPGGGSTGNCEPFAIPTLSECPFIFPDDSTCQGKCGVPANRCKNSKGKTKPTGY